MPSNFQPQGFKQVVFIFWVAERIQRLSLQNSIPTPIGKFAFGMVSCVLFGSLEMIDGPLDNRRWAILCRDTPDAALSLVGLEHRKQTDRYEYGPILHGRPVKSVVGSMATGEIVLAIPDRYRRLHQETIGGLS